MSDLEMDNDQAGRLAALIVAGVLSAFVLPTLIEDGLADASQAKLASQPADPQVPAPAPAPALTPAPTLALTLTLTLSLALTMTLTLTLTTDPDPDHCP